MTVGGLFALDARIFRRLRSFLHRSVEIQGVAGVRRLGAGRDIERAARITALPYAETVGLEFIRNRIHEKIEFLVRQTIPNPEIVGHARYVKRRPVGEQRQGDARRRIAAGILNQRLDRHPGRAGPNEDGDRALFWQRRHCCRGRARYWRLHWGCGWRRRGDRRLCWRAGWCWG